MYKTGESNIADPMSKLCDKAGSQKEKFWMIRAVTVEYIAMIAQQAVPVARTWQEIKSCLDNSSIVQEMKKALRIGRWEKCSASIKSVRSELSECNGVILRGKCIFISKNLQDRILKLADEGHHGIVKSKQRLRSKVW